MGDRNYKCATASDTPLLGRGPLLFGAIASKMLARLKTKDEHCTASLLRVVFSLVLMRYTVQIHG